MQQRTSIISASGAGLSEGHFVIACPWGDYWDGKDWTRDKASAHRYLGPLDPNGEARKLVADFKANGRACFLIFYPCRPSGSEGNKSAKPRRK